MLLGAAAGAAGSPTGGAAPAPAPPPAAPPAVELPPEAGLEVAWSAALGSETYGGPSVGGGRVLVGTNNAGPRAPRVDGDRGVVMAFDAAGGGFLWQATSGKLGSSAVDWPLQGICSTPLVDGDRVFWVSNRGELIAAEVTGEVVWTLDLVGRLGVRPRYMSASSPRAAGGLVFVLAGNGVDDAGRVPAPAAPSFVAVDRATGEPVWTDGSPGDGLVDGAWSSPTLAAIGGGGSETLALFPAADGRLYAFAAPTGERRWVFDAAAGCAEPSEAAEPDCRRPLVAAAAAAGGRVYVGLGRDPQLGAGPGRLWAVDLGTGEPLWSVGGDDFGLTLSTPAVADGLVYAADLAGFVYCFDAATGELQWRYDTFAEVWGSPLVAGGRVYVGDADGDLAILAAGRTLRLVAEPNLGAAIHTTPAIAGETLYVATRNRLWALAPTGRGGAGTGRDPHPAAGPAAGDPSRIGTPDGTR
jgi:outer membrane protein assembly factor BamB